MSIKILPLVSTNGNSHPDRIFQGAHILIDATRSRAPIFFQFFYFIFPHLRCRIFAFVSGLWFWMCQVCSKLELIVTECALFVFCIVMGDSHLLLTILTPPVRSHTKSFYWVHQLKHFTWCTRITDMRKHSSAVIHSHCINIIIIIITTQLWCNSNYLPVNELNKLVTVGRMYFNFINQQKINLTNFQFNFQSDKKSGILRMRLFWKWQQICLKAIGNQNMALDWDSAYRWEFLLNKVWYLKINLWINQLEAGSLIQKLVERVKLL